MGSPKRADKVFVDKTHILEELITNETRVNSGRLKTGRLQQKKSSNGSIGSSDSSYNASVMLLKEQRVLQNHQTEIIMQNNIKKALENNREKQERQFPIILSNVSKAQTFLDTVDKDLNLLDETKRNKTRRQFEEWNANVHGHIQKRISKTVSGMDSKALNRRKNDDYNQFLAITNRKPAIFRDIIIESEYDPLEPNRRCVVARSGPLKDPVKIDAQKAAEEAAMLGGPVRPKQRLGKDTLPVEQWATGKIEATPYGTFAKMMSGGGGAAKETATTRSSVVFDHFSYPRGRAAIDAEMPRGKRVHPQPIYADPSRALGVLSPSVEKEVATIRAPESHSWAVAI